MGCLVAGLLFGACPAAPAQTVAPDPAPVLHPDPAPAARAVTPSPAPRATPAPRPTSTASTGTVPVEKAQRRCSSCAGTVPVARRRQRAVAVHHHRRAPAARPKVARAATRAHAGAIARLAPSRDAAGRLGLALAGAVLLALAAGGALTLNRATTRQRA